MDAELSSSKPSRTSSGLVSSSTSPSTVATVSPAFLMKELQLAVETVEVAMLALPAMEDPVDDRFLLTVEATRVVTPRHLPVTPLRDTVVAAAVTTPHLIVVTVSVLLRLVVVVILIMVDLVVRARGLPSLVAPLPWMTILLPAPVTVAVVPTTTPLPGADTRMMLATTEPTAAAVVVVTMTGAVILLAHPEVQGPLHQEGVQPHPLEEAMMSMIAAGTSGAAPGFEDIPTGPKSHRSSNNANGTAAASGGYNSRRSE